MNKQSNSEVLRERFIADSFYKIKDRPRIIPRFLWNWMLKTVVYINTAKASQLFKEIIKEVYSEENVEEMVTQLSRKYSTLGIETCLRRAKVGKE